MTLIELVALLGAVLVIALAMWSNHNMRKP